MNSGFQTVPEGFEIVSRPHGDALVLKGRPIWITHYEEVRGHHAEHWRVYRSVDYLPKGRDPWTVNNLAVGTKDGFKSLEAAVQAALEAA